MTEIAARLALVRTRIAQAAECCGRDPTSVRLVAVSKFHPERALREAYAAGQRDFGENYAQELVEKAQLLRDLPEIRFRFIGSFQRNKSRLLVDAGCAIETLTAEPAARALDMRAVQHTRRVEVMIQVNVLGEARKGGVAPAELSRLVTQVRALSSLHLTGLMTIPPADDLDAAEHAYTALAELARVHGLSELSMGMSDDLEIAIRAGATSVRVGTAIFGQRPHPAGV